MDTSRKLAFLAISGLFLTPLASQAGIYGATAIVAQSGGDYGDPQSAVADLGNWCGTPSAANRCLIKVMAGTFDIGSPALLIPSHVDLAGSGQEATTLTDSATETTVTLANQTSLSNLTVDSGTQTRSKNVGVTLQSGYQSVRNVTIVVHPTSSNTTGIAATNSTALIDNTTIRIPTGSGWNTGIKSFNGEMSIRNSDIDVTGNASSVALGIDQQGRKINVTKTRINAHGTSVNEAIRLQGAGLVVSYSELYAIEGTNNKALSLVYGAGFDWISMRYTDVVGRTGSGTNYAVYLNSGVNGNNITHSTLSGQTASVFVQGNTLVRLSENMFFWTGVTTQGASNVQCGGNTTLFNGVMQEAAPNTCP